MRARWIFFGVLSIAAGFGFGLILPRSWGFVAPYGVLFAAAIFVLGFMRRSLLRVVLFLAVTALLLHVRYGAREHVDLTWPLTTIASWSLVEGWLGRRTTEKTAAWTRGNS